MLANVLPAHSSPLLDALYYISKGQKTVGPCSLDDLYGYIAYGSVRDSDLVRREGSTEWTPLRQLDELQIDPADPATVRDITTRRRTARLRDYVKVPKDRRAGVVLARLIWGSLIFPPLLWKGAKAVFQDRIYSARTDAKGYLLYWPRWVEAVVMALLVVNSIAWLCLLGWIWREATPLGQEISGLLRTGIHDLQDWLGK